MSSVRGSVVFMEERKNVIEIAFKEKITEPLWGKRWERVGEKKERKKKGFSGGSCVGKGREGMAKGGKRRKMVCESKKSYQGMKE